MKNILVIEDSREIQILIEASLKSFKVNLASTIAEGQRMLSSGKFDLLILDIELPDGDGLKFLGQLSDMNVEVPVFMLTSKVDISNKMTAFHIGAEDYITKPFDPLELNARVTAKLKRAETQKEKSEVLRIGDVVVTIQKQTAHQVDAQGGAGNVLDLTKLEFKILLFLAKNRDKIFSREVLLKEVWGGQVYISDRTVDAHIAHLRKKLQPTTVKIETVVGQGYRLTT